MNVTDYSPPVPIYQCILGIDAEYSVYFCHFWFNRECQRVSDPEARPILTDSEIFVGEVLAGFIFLELTGTTKIFH